jgi:pimeloyl-ACP methyl ester carboxylesterase
MNNLQITTEGAMTYRHLGHGNTNIVFVHGFGASKDVWVPLLRHIPTDKFSIYTIDLLGHGDSKVNERQQLTMHANVKLIGDFLVKNNIQNPILVGHSYGGSVSLLYTLLNEQSDYRPRALILLDTPTYKMVLPGFVALLRVPILSELLTSIIPADTQVESTLRELYFNREKINQETVERYAKYLTRKSVRQALRRTARAINADQLEAYVARYSELDIPIQLIFGKDDPIVPLSSQKRFVKEVRSARLAIVSNCGHNVHEECAEDTANLLIDFITRIAK